MAQANSPKLVADEMPARKRFGFDVPIASRVFRISLPIVIAMLTQTAINIVDTVFVGRLPASYSVAGQSAIGYSLILLWAFGGFLASIQVGTQAIVARRQGEGDTEAAGAAATNSITIALIAGLTVSLLGYFGMGWIFSKLDSNPTVVELGTSYAEYRMLGILSMTMTMSYKSFFDGIGKTHVHLIAAAIMNVCNFFLDWVLIFGVGPFPQMYVAGAGLGSLISTYIGIAFLIGWSFLGKYRRTYRYYRLSNLSARISWDIIRVSVPGGLATVFVMLGFGVFLVVVGQIDSQLARAEVNGLALYAESAYRSAIDGFGGNPLFADSVLHRAKNALPVNTSATKIIIDIMSLSFMSMIALGTGTATLVGQSLGAGRPDLAERFGWESAKLGSALMLLFAVFAAAFPEVSIAAFNPDPRVIATGAPTLRMMAFSAVFIAVGLVLAQSLYGAGMTRYVMIVEAILHVVCLMPLSYVLGIWLDLGLQGIWAAAFAYVVLLTVAMVYKFREGKWKEVKL